MDIADRAQRRAIGDRTSKSLRCPARGVRERQQDLDERRLTGAVRTKNAEDFSGLDGKAHAVQRGNRRASSPAGGICLYDVRKSCDWGRHAGGKAKLGEVGGRSGRGNDLCIAARGALLHQNYRHRAVHNRGERGLQFCLSLG